jgi:hypothetical protein
LVGGRKRVILLKEVTKMKTYQVLGALLGYSDTALIEALPESAEARELLAETAHIHPLRTTRPPRQALEPLCDGLRRAAGACGREAAAECGCAGARAG